MQLLSLAGYLIMNSPAEIPVIARQSERLGELIEERIVTSERAEMPEQLPSHKQWDHVERRVAAAARVDVLVVDGRDVWTVVSIARAVDRPRLLQNPGPLSVNAIPSRKHRLVRCENRSRDTF